MNAKKYKNSIGDSEELRDETLAKKSPPPVVRGRKRNHYSMVGTVP